MSKTAAQIISAACRDANVKVSNIGGDEEALRLLYRALVSFWRDFGSFETTQDITDATTPALTSGTQEYAIDSEVDEIRRVIYRTGSTGAWVALPQVSHEAKYDYTDSGTPGAWYLRRPAGARVLGLVPAPNATVAASFEYKLLYTVKPTAPTATSDTIPVTNEEAEAVTLELAAMMAERTGDEDTAARLRAQVANTRGKTAETELKLTGLPLSHPFGDLVLPGASLFAGEGLTERGY